MAGSDPAHGTVPVSRTYLNAITGRAGRDRVAETPHQALAGGTLTTMLEFRRTWRITLDGVEHEIVIEYAALFGWMSIFVDGARAARGWREWQSVWGGAELTANLGGHRLDARVTQPFGRQEYSFALRVDGIIQPGSDELPPPRNVKRATAIALGGIALVVAVVTLAAQLR